ncbi:tyrosine-type recombinase/integrase [Streptomyces sp. ALI-76-A]|uniref:tyrosine-type recombinase/integrase n=1 Tax=Streptomyces sp. ALI-76-A TaxID=3025736 RepID=UPI00256F105E|nr:tyrosine-type recombinase/integrase [Streptomyces sp. ALI-76-A]MDL5199537.1 tyrosine-type recombinase/integrase [Streptomyces sp. ALI-76-A]
MSTEATELEEIVDAEIVDDHERLLPVAGAPVPYRITRHTILAEGELPPRADEEPPFTAKDFKVPDRVKKRITERGARNTRVNRDSTRTRFEQWCAKEGRIAQPTTTTANVAAYFGYLMETGKQDGSKYSPDSLLAYCSRIVSWYPKGERPDASLVREMIEDYRLEEFIPAGGEKEQSAGLTLKYLVKVLAKIDESTRIGRRDAAMLVLQYGMLYRSIEVTNLLVKQIRVDTDGVWVWTAMSKTRRKGKGRWRFIRDRADLQFVARVRAWLADLRELCEPTEHDQNPAVGESAYLPTKPLFRALTTTGNLKRRKNATVRGLFLTGRAVNEMVKARAKAAGVSLINGLKVTSHSLRAGPNTDMAQALVPLADRNTAGDWSEKSELADNVYNRPDGSIDVSKKDPLDAVPLFGRPLTASVTSGNAAEPPLQDAGLN